MSFATLVIVEMAYFGLIISSVSVGVLGRELLQDAAEDPNLRQGYRRWRTVRAKRGDTSLDLSSS